MKRYSTLTEERYLLLFVKYLNVMKSYGEGVKNIPKSILVTEAAEMVKLSPERSARIINKMLKERKHPHNITIMECNELLQEIEATSKFINDKFEKKVNALNSILIRVGIDRTHDEVKGLVQEFLIYG
jgi:hypothetical protein